MKKVGCDHLWVMHALPAKKRLCQAHTRLLCSAESGGIMYFSTIEGDYVQSGYETSSNGEYYYYKESDLKETNQLELTELTRKDYIKSNGEGSTHLICIARK